MQKCIVIALLATVLSLAIFSPLGADENSMDFKIKIDRLQRRLIQIEQSSNKTQAELDKTKRELAVTNKKLEQEIAERSPILQIAVHRDSGGAKTTISSFTNANSVPIKVKPKSDNSTFLVEVTFHYVVDIRDKKNTIGCYKLWKPVPGGYMDISPECQIYTAHRQDGIATVGTGIIRAIIENSSLDEQNLFLAHAAIGGSSVRTAYIIATVTEIEN